MIGIIESMGICKVRIRASKSRCLRVHHIRKRRVAPGHMLRQGITHFIGGFEQQSIEALAHRHGITLCHVNSYRSGFQVGCGRSGKDNRIIQTAVFRHQKRCHQLCDTGRIKLGIPVL